MIIDSPIISGSSAASGSLNQFGNVAITGSLTVTGAITGAVTGSVDSASYASNATSASYATNASAANTAVSSSYPLAVTKNIIYTPLGGVSPNTTFATGSNQTTIILGYQAGLNTTGSSNEGEGSIYMGAYAGKNSYNNYSTIFIGDGAGESSTYNAFSTMIGAYAGYQATASYESLIIGYEAGFRNENSHFTTIVGEGSGYRIKASPGATILGNNAGSQVLSSSYSTIVGYYAGPYVKNSPGSVFIAPWSGEDSMSGSYSIVIGNSSGRLRIGNQTLGTNNIIIGTNIALTPGTNHGINIGGLIFGSGSAFQGMNSNGSGYVGYTNSFTGSANGKIGINQPNPQYNFDVSGSGNFTNGLTVTGSIVGALTGTASYASNANLLDGLDSTQFTLTSSFSAYTASLNNFSASILSYTSSTDLRINALDQYTASLNTRSASFACVTATNNFACTQYFSNTSNAVSFTSTGSLYSDGGLRITKDMYVSGTAFFNNVTVFGTQSINYITSSQLNISTNLITVNTDTPSIRFGGLAVYDSGSTGLTGSILWDSEDNQWIYSNPSGSTYDSAVFLVGPRNVGVLGNEPGISCNFLSKGNGLHHMTSSGIFEDGSRTCFYGNSYIDSSGNSCQAGYAVVNNCLGIGTASPSVYGVDASNASNSVYFKATSNATTAYYGAATALGTGVAGTFSNHDFALYANSIERARITATGIACFACQVCAPVAIFSGCVGIGTSSPIEKLVVVGNIYTNGTNTNLYLDNGGAGGASLKIGVIGTTETYINSLDADPLWFGTHNTERMRISSTGIACFACQICTTSAALSGNVIFNRANTSAGNNIEWRTASTLNWYIGTRGLVNNNFYFVNEGLGANNLILDAASGVATFACNVTVNSTITAAQSTAETSAIVASSGWSGTINNPIITFGRVALAVAGQIGYDDPNTGLYIGTCTNHRLAIRTNNTDRLVISNTGIATFACQVCAPTFLGSTATLATAGTACTVSGVLTLASLQTGGTSVCAGAAIIFEGNNGATVARIYSRGNMNFNNGSDLVFQTQVSAGGTPQCTMVINGGSQNVGIGTFNPGYKLDVRGYTYSAGYILNPELGIETVAGSPYAGMFAGVSSFPGGYGSVVISSRPDLATPIVFATSNGSVSTERVRIAGNGIACFACTVCAPIGIFSTCVGINVTSPDAPLRIHGGAGSTSTVIIAGGAVGNDNATISAPYSMVFQIDNTGGVGGRSFSFRCGGKGYSDGTQLIGITSAGHIIPGANGTQDLGSSSFRWCTIYTSDLSLNNGIGNYTIVEGENDLFLYNNNSCKVFKFVVQEVCPEIAPAKRSI